MKHLITSLALLTVCFVTPVRAALPTAVEEAIAELRPAGGWAVCVGTTDGEMERKLAADARFVVTGLAYDHAVAEKARAAAADAGLAGRAAFHEVLDTSRLPMVSSSVALLVIDPRGLNGTMPTDMQIRRVLRPGGIAVLLNEGGARTVKGERPKSIDDWTHFNYDASATDASRDELAGPIKSLRWLGGDPFQDDIVGMRTSAGVYVTIEQNDPPGPVAAPHGAIVARDAFSGTVLWRRPGFYVRSRYSFIVDGQRVYVHALDAATYRHAANFRQPHEPNVRSMIALDLFTGEDRVVYDQGLHGRTTPPDGRSTPVSDRADTLMHALVVDGKLIQRLGRHLFVLDAATGRKLWSYTAPGEHLLGFAAASDGKVVVAHGPLFDRDKMGYLQNTPIFSARGFVALDLATGKEVWASEPAALVDYPHIIRIAAAHGVIGMTAYKDYKNTQLRPALITLDLKTGKQLWVNDSFKGESSGGHYPRPQIHHDKVWAAGAGGGVGFDLRTGQNALQLTAKNFRCSHNRATPHWLISSQKFHHIESNKAFFTESTRGRCDFGLFPANGLVYGSIGDQCGCAAFVRPTAAFAQDRPPAEPWSGQRLLAGPAGAGKSTTYKLDDNAWPMFLHDARHSSWTSATVRADASEAWKIKLSNAPDTKDAVQRAWATHQEVPGPVTAPTILHDTLCVAISHEQTVVTLDPTNGKEQWRAHVDGRIDSPPTLAGDSVFVGTRTGWVYALDRATGKLRWRFLAAPHQQLLVAHGQAESAWPVFGSVLLHGGLIWAAAGRQAELDHGIVWYALDPATGAVRKEGRLAETADWHEQFAATRTRATNQPLCTDGKLILLWRSGIDPDTGQQVRFGSTIKQGRGTDRAAFALLGSAKWGKMRIDEGASYAGFGGMLFAFNDADALGVVGNVHQSLVRFEFDRDDALKKDGWGQRVEQKQLWTFKKVPRSRDENACLLHAGGTAILGTHEGLHLLDAKTGELKQRIESIHATTHGAAAASGRLFVVTRAGQLICLK